MSVSRAPWLVAFVLSLAVHGGLLYWLTSSQPKEVEAGSGGGSSVVGADIDMVAGFSVPVDAVDPAEAPPAMAPTQEVAAAQPMATASAATTPEASAAPTTEAATVQGATPAPASVVQAVASADATDALPSAPNEALPPSPSTEIAPPAPTTKAASANREAAPTPSAAPPEASPVETAEVTPPAAKPVEAASPQTQEVAAIDPPPPVPAQKPDLPEPVKPKAKVVEKQAVNAETKAVEKKTARTRRGQGSVDSRKGAEVADSTAKSNDSGVGIGREAGTGSASMSDYNGRVRAKIQRAMRYDRRAANRGESGSAVVSFYIGPGGSISGVNLVSSSGASALDQAALDTVRRAAPFPDPPDGRHYISVPLVFSLER